MLASLSSMCVILCSLLVLALCTWPPVLIMVAGLTNIASFAVSLLRMTFGTCSPSGVGIGSTSCLLSMAGTMRSLISFLPPVVLRTFTSTQPMSSLLCSSLPCSSVSLWSVALPARLQ